MAYDDSNIFARILRDEVPCRRVYEDDHALAFHDINPLAPVHVLVIPKREVATLNDLRPGDEQLVGGMFLVAQKLMKELGHTDYRTVFNCGPQAGQTVFHIHLHVLAGRQMNWPPG